MFSSSLDLCFSQTLCLRSLDNRDIIARGQYRHSCHKRFNKYMGNEFNVNHEFMLSDFGTHMFNDHRSMPSDDHLKFLRLWWPTRSTPGIEVAGNLTQTKSDFKNQFKQFSSNTHSFKRHNHLSKYAQPISPVWKWLIRRRL